MTPTDQLLVALRYYASPARYNATVMFPHTEVMADKGAVAKAALAAENRNDLSSDEAGTGRSGEMISPVALAGGCRSTILDQPARPEERNTIGQSSLGQLSADDRALINDLRYADQALDHGHIAEVKETCWRAQERLAALASLVPPVPSVEDAQLIERLSSARQWYFVEDGIRLHSNDPKRAADRLAALSRQPDRDAVIEETLKLVDEEATREAKLKKFEPDAVFAQRTTTMTAPDKITISREWAERHQALIKSAGDYLMQRGKIDWPTLKNDMAELEAALSQPSEEGWEPTHQHVKTGGLYRIVAHGLIEADLTPAVIYQAKRDGSVWVRPASEFDDGRFVAYRLASGER